MDMYIAHQKGWSGLQYMQKSNYGAILPILAALWPLKDAPHRPNTVPVACELSGLPRGPPGMMVWAAEGGSGAMMMDESGDIKVKGFGGPWRRQPPAPAI